MLDVYVALKKDSRGEGGHFFIFSLLCFFPNPTCFAVGRVFRTAFRPFPPPGAVKSRFFGSAGLGVAVARPARVAGVVGSIPAAGCNFFGFLFFYQNLRILQRGMFPGRGTGTFHSWMLWAAGLVVEAVVAERWRMRLVTGRSRDQTRRRRHYFFFISFIVGLSLVAERTRSGC